MSENPALGETSVSVSVIMPCLNEAVSVGACVQTALHSLDHYDPRGEVIVVNNGSTDGSSDVSRAAGARVISEPRLGYGSAYLAGFDAARGRYLVLGDADGSYDFREIPRFVAELDGGADLVLGDRMKHIQAGAMPWMHRKIGNPLMTRMLRRRFKTDVRDAWCGMRALRADTIPIIDLRAEGMEFALEMVIRAAQENLELRQLDIELHPRTGGNSKLRTIRDGWRALRFISNQSRMQANRERRIREASLDTGRPSAAG